jgi:hypothetical protein
MSKSVSNVNIATDTFFGLYTKTNILLDSLTNEIVTTSNTLNGSSTHGNASIVGIFSANLITTPVLRGGASGNTANISTLTLGLSNSTTSSNVTIVGYAANVVVNTFYISSNISITASNTYIVSNNIQLLGNTQIWGNNSVSVIQVNGNTTTTFLNVTGTNTNIKTAAFNVNSVSTVTGNTFIKANNSVTNISISGNNTTSNVTLTGNAVNITCNTTLSGSVTNISGNFNVNNNTFFVDSSNNLVGVGTSTPRHRLHVIGTGTMEIFSIENATDNSAVLVSSTNAYAGGNTITIYAGTGNQLKLASNNDTGTGYLFFAANGNVGLSNIAPQALLSISNTKVYSNGTIQTGGDLICSGDLYANIVFIGGTDQNTVTATVCPIVPPNTIYSSNTSFGGLTGPYSFLQFTNTTPQAVDVIGSEQGLGYQAVKFVLQIQDNEAVDEVVMTEVNVVYGYGNVHSTQFGTIFTNTNFVEVGTSANSTAILLVANPTETYLASKGGSANLQFRGIRQKVR